jgi:hypothetical protein
VMSDVRKAVAACTRSTFDSGEASTPSRPAWVTHQWSVLDRDFAGDESLLLRHEVLAREKATGEQLGDHLVTLFAVVRVRDLVTVIKGEGRTEARMRQLGQSAATRLCRATSPPC